MALHGNRSVLHKSPGRFLNGYGTAGGGIASMRSAFSKHGTVRNAYEQFDAKSATPNGHLSPSAWVLPKRAGGMSSRNVAVLSISPTGSGAMGVPIEGTSAFTIDTNTPAGQLISSAIGSASFVFTPTGNVLATLSGIGESAMTFTTNTPAMSAQGWALASGAITVTATMTSYAKGMMIGSTLTGGALTEASIIAAMNASPPAVNIKKVNDVTVNGDGAGTPWGP